MERRRAIQSLTERSAASHAKMDAPHQKELPPFQLRLQATDAQPPLPSKPEILSSLGPFTFSYNPAIETGGTAHQAEDVADD